MVELSAIMVSSNGEFKTPINHPCCNFAPVKLGQEHKICSIVEIILNQSKAIFKENSTILFTIRSWNRLHGLLLSRSHLVNFCGGWNRHRPGHIILFFQRKFYNDYKFLCFSVAVPFLTCVRVHLGKLTFPCQFRLLDNIQSSFITNLVSNFSDQNDVAV